MQCELGPRRSSAHPATESGCGELGPGGFTLPSGTQMAYEGLDSGGSLGCAAGSLIVGGQRWGRLHVDVLNVYHSRPDHGHRMVTEVRSFWFAASQSGFVSRSGHLCLSPAYVRPLKVLQETSLYVCPAQWRLCGSALTGDRTYSAGRRDGADTSLHNSTTPRRWSHVLSHT